MGPKGCIHTHNETKLETALGFNNHCIHCAELHRGDCKKTAVMLVLAAIDVKGESKQKTSART